MNFIQTYIKKVRDKKANKQALESWHETHKDKLDRLPFDDIEIYSVKGSLISQSYSRRYYEFRRVIESRDNLKTSYANRHILYEKIEQCIDDNQIARISQYIMLMRSLDDLTLWHEEIRQVCDCFILLPGEPLNDFSSEHSKRKRELFDTNDDVKLFFCNFGIEFLRTMDDTLKNTDALDCLNSKEHQLVEQIYSHLMSNETNKESLTNSTKN